MSRKIAIWFCCGLLVAGPVLSAEEGVGADQPKSESGPALTGTWLLRTPEVEVVLELQATGQYSQKVRSNEGEEVTRGTYEVKGDRIIFRAEVAAFKFRLVEGNTLELLAEDGTGLQLARTAGSPGAGEKQTGVEGQTTGGLDDPVPEEVMALARELVKPLADPMARPPGIKVPGWNTAFVNTGWFMYPGDWTIEQSPDRNLTRVGDPRGLTQYWFAGLDQLPGNPTPDQMLRMVLGRVLEREGGNVPIKVLTSAMRPSLIPTMDDSGQEHLWTGRWLHPKAGKMFFRVTVLILARSPIGAATPTLWTFNSCPEAEAVQTWKDVFGVMNKSAVFPPPGGSNIKPDRDGDGVPDETDRDPDDPNVW